MRSLVTEGAQVLAAAGVESAPTDAASLLAHVLGVPRSVLAGVDAVDVETADRFHGLIARRAAREPLQYITGEAPFRFDVLAVGPGVFIPRPETELLIDAVLPTLRSVPAPIAVDLCAGSGALAVAIAHEVPTARVVAVERSAAALTWLRRNADGWPVEVVAADVAEPGLLAELDGRVDVVVSNPPYVPAGTMVGVEVSHDPSDAVFAAADGLAVIPAVLALAARLLRPGGILAVEHDETQAAAVLALLAESAGWTDAADHRDLTGRDRYATAIRRWAKMAT